MNSLRFGKIYEGGIYHIFNRGTEKRIIFNDKKDLDRFLSLCEVVNNSEEIGSIRNLQLGNFKEKLEGIRLGNRLVEIYGFCLLPNHYHLVARSLTDDGLSKFIQKLSAGYTKYYNIKNDRTGALFQGKYKYIEIDEDSQLMKVIAYVNRNHEIHGILPDTHRARRTVSGHEFIEKGEIGDLPLALDEGVKVFGGLGDYRGLSKSIVDEIIDMRKKEDKNGLVDM